MNLLKTNEKELKEELELLYDFMADIIGNAEFIGEDECDPETEAKLDILERIIDHYIDELHKDKPKTTQELIDNVAADMAIRSRWAWEDDKDVKITLLNEIAQDIIEASGGNLYDPDKPMKLSLEMKQKLDLLDSIITEVR